MLADPNFQGDDGKTVGIFAAHLEGANLDEVDLSGARLNGLDLRGVDLSGVKSLSKTKFVKADLSRANLRGANLKGANLSGANLTEADLTGAEINKVHHSRVADARQILGGLPALVDEGLDAANLRGANLHRAILRAVDLRWMDLRSTNLHGADLTRANLVGINLAKKDLRQAKLNGADLSSAILVDTDFREADLTGCRIHGVAAWNVNLEGANQSSLVITHQDEPDITVDDLEVAQFIYLLLNRAKLRNVIDSITSKAVLILGRFTPERKVVLDAIADELRKHDLLPILFDFERSKSRDMTETVKTLAGLSFFVIADITNPKSSPLELQATIPDYQIPFVQIIQEGEAPFSMFVDLASKYPWVLGPVLAYRSVEQLLQTFKVAILDRVWEKHRELERRKVAVLDMTSLDAFLHES